MSGKGFSRSDLDRLVAAAASPDDLKRATGGELFRLGAIEPRNALLLKLNERYYVYARPQSIGESRDKAYQTTTLQTYLDPKGVRKAAGEELDHVASIGVEGKKIGASHVLMAWVPRKVNRQHGNAYEKGPAPMRELNAAVRKGQPDVAKASPLDKQMVGKLCHA